MQKLKLNTAFKRNNEDNLMKRKIKKILLLTRLFSKKNKVTKEQREENRGKRHELQLIISRSRQICFTYICKREKPAKICFGSTLLRQTLPREPKYMSPLMRKVYGAPSNGPGPTTYTLETSLVKRFPNKSGYSLLASKVPRMASVEGAGTPSVGTYDIDKKKPIQKSRVPFGINADYNPSGLVTPAPGCYNFFKRTVNVQDSFGGKRFLVPAVKVVCTPLNFAICKICNQVPLGDYWRNFRTKEDMCRPCMKLQMNELKSCSTIRTVAKIRKLAELKAFERARYCDFYHKHSGTRAALPVMDKQVLKRKLCKENYLAMFNM